MIKGTSAKASPYQPVCIALIVNDMNCDELQNKGKASCYLVKRPKALQWFHNGRLCKESEEERQAGRFELFLDLLCKTKPLNFCHESEAR